MKTVLKLSKSFILAGTILFTSLSGCATVDQKIDLNYVPIDTSLGLHNGDIAVTRIDPKSATRNSRGEWIIGSLNNVNGVHQADLLSDSSIGELITDALLLELKKTGYTVTYTATLPSGVALGIVINGINEFLNVNKGVVSDSVKHELKFNIEIYLNGIKTKTLSLASRDSQTFPLRASKEDHEKIVRQSLQGVMKQIIPEIIAQTGKK